MNTTSKIRIFSCNRKGQEGNILQISARIAHLAITHQNNSGKSSEAFT
ncbi:MAG: hypothetical protein MUE81_13750 [Thermoflexibacter sp.]|nr:hypothetical protein [Thermoflexibacter sp.]